MGSELIVASISQVVKAIIKHKLVCLHHRHPPSNKGRGSVSRLIGRREDSAYIAAEYVLLFDRIFSDRAQTDIEPESFGRQTELA